MASGLAEHIRSKRDWLTKASSAGPPEAGRLEKHPGCAPAYPVSSSQPTTRGSDELCQHEEKHGHVDHPPPAPASDAVRPLVDTGLVLERVAESASGVWSRRATNRVC
jgi:hypothetical protein